MKNENSFKSFNYVVGNDFVYKDKVEVKVFFIYKNKNIVLSLFIKKKENAPESYYINEVKKIINQKIKDASLKAESEKYIAKAKKKKFLLRGALVTSALILAGVGVGSYFIVHANHGGGGGGDDPTQKGWYKDTAYINSLTPEDVTKENPDGSIGVVQTIKVNGLDHKVRLIGVEQDVDSEGNKIHTTWEFANLISDENGYSLASLWQDDEDGEDANFDYLNSTIRKNLTGYGNGSIMWYEKDSATRSSRSQSVLDMLPSDLKSVLKIAKKKVNLKVTGSWVETDVCDELFLLSANEVNGKAESAEEGEAYEYYKNAEPEEADPIRIKQQVKGAKGARTDSIDITDNAYGEGFSYAGYNSSTEGYGAELWLRSPTSNEWNLISSWNVLDTGEVDTGLVYISARGVAPAFCI